MCLVYIYSADLALLRFYMRGKNRFFDYCIILCCSLLFLDLGKLTKQLILLGCGTWELVLIIFAQVLCIQMLSMFVRILWSKLWIIFVLLVLI